MSTLLQRLHLGCPYQRARAYLAEQLASIVTSGTPQVLSLRIPISIGNGSALEKDVVVTFAPGEDPLHFDQPWHVQWEPRDGGPFPAFDGTLTVCSDEDYHRSVLQLQGHYHPPLGKLGAAFDAIVGTRIASATAREFLRILALHMESMYHSEEAAKNT